MRIVTRREYDEYAAAHPDQRVERTALGELVVMPLSDGRSGARNFRILVDLGNWARADGRGRGFDSSTGFDLPNGANRAPDASWVLHSRLAELTEDDRDGYLPLCPDFVIEVRSKSDSLRGQMDKMTEYIGNGAQLGWLLDPLTRKAYVYRPGRGVEVYDNPTELRGGPELPGFVLDLRRVWDPGF